MTLVERLERWASAAAMKCPTIMAYEIVLVREAKDALEAAERERNSWAAVAVNNRTEADTLRTERDTLAAQLAEAREVLERARRFIVNGVEFGFIRMPDEGDPALDTLPAIEAALSTPAGEGEISPEVQELAGALADLALDGIVLDDEEDSTNAE